MVNPLNDGSSQPGVTASGAADLEHRAGDLVKRLFATTLKLDVHRVDADEVFDKYGIDSVRVLQLTHELEASFGPLPTTLFFEYQTIAAIGRYLVQAHRQTCERLFGATPADGDAVTAVAERPAERGPTVHGRLRRRGRLMGGLGETAAPADGGFDIAIIGMSGRYPQARDLATFWANLRAGRDCITEIPATRWAADAYFDARKGVAGTSYSRWGGFVDGVDEFDPLFFHISPREAEVLDPQERLFLQCAYATLEDAGYTRQALQTAVGGRVGVFVGVMYSEYQLYGAQAQALGRPLAVPGSVASIANRVSYVCGFHGPSLAVDTMCSSSLTSVHLACESLRAGACALALAGGVNLSLHPNKYLVLSAGQFASSTGRCASFGAGGDGYVPGEGVGAVLLKPRAQAEADGDHIYALVRGSALNHGGKTHGYTVPHPGAQASVITTALRAAGVPAASVSYVEAHGTGTALGDPIEVAGLTQAWTAAGGAGATCALGSVKSNIGHAESAAGIAAVTKVVLQLQHQELVPSLHATPGNPAIAFAATPFRVVETVTPWARPVVEVDGVARAYPRRAGVSSFGAGGANAHVILEEYDGAPAAPAADLEVAIVLSAQTPVQLTEQASQLLAWLARPETAAVPVADLAYTLQVGRDALTERLATTVTSRATLVARLTAAVAGDLQDWQRGTVRAGASGIAIWAREAGAHALVAGWVAARRYAPVLALWVQGVAVPWAAGGAGRRRVSLPTYPFARERYWVAVPTTPMSAAPRHALLHENVSTAWGLTFRSQFTGSEWLFRDHQVQGQPVLAAASHVEMARAAVAAGLASTNPVRLRDVVWVRPLSGSPMPPIEVRIEATTPTAAVWEIVRGDAADDDETAVYSQGTAEVVDATPPPVDLAWLASVCSEAPMPGAALIARSARTGLTYGPAHQALTTVRRGVDAAGRPHVWATLTVPPSAEAAGVVAHPSVLDGALQAIGVLPDATPGVPFAAKAVTVFRATPAQATAWVRPSARAGGVDIDVCDAAGAVCVTVEGLQTRPLPRQTAALARPDVVRWAPQWMPAAPSAPGAVAWTTREICVIGTLTAADETTLRAAWGSMLHVVAPPEDLLPAAYAAVTAAVVERVQAQLRRGAAAHLLQVVVLADPETPAVCYRGLSGLLKTATREQPQLLTQCVQVLPTMQAATLMSAIDAEAQDLQAAERRYVAGQREVLRWCEIAPAAASASPWTPGVYLLTGGAGGLGRQVASMLAAAVPGVTLVLIGRSAPSAATAAQVAALTAAGARAVYCAVDLADAAAVQALVADVTATHGPLTGVLHAAGVLQDALLVQHPAEAWATVFAPKVSGLVHLDEATATQPLAHFVCFSSAAAVVGNAGQAAYAAANAFMDAFVHARAAQVAAGTRHGRTLTINWPLWDAGGMQVDADGRAQLRARGLAPMATADGLAALDACVAAAAEHPQVLVLAGDADAIRRAFVRPGVSSAGDDPTAADSALPPVPATDPHPDPLSGELVARTAVPLHDGFALESAVPQLI